MTKLLVSTLAVFMTAGFSTQAFGKTTAPLSDSNNLTVVLESLASQGVKPLENRVLIGLLAGGSVEGEGLVRRAVEI